MNGSIKILVVKRVLIVPDAGGRVAHFVTHEPNSIVMRIGLNLIYRRASPGFDSWLLTHRAAYRTKTKRLVDAGYRVLLVRGVVVHVALVRVNLAPGTFVRHDVLRFGKICRARV